VHADNRRHEGQQRQPGRSKLPCSDVEQAERQRNGRNGERQTERLHEIVLLEADALQIGYGWDHECAGRAGCGRCRLRLCVKASAALPVHARALLDTLRRSSA
jgi:hypothetical protein